MELDTDNTDDMLKAIAICEKRTNKPDRHCELFKHQMALDLLSKQDQEAAHLAMNSYEKECMDLVEFENDMADQLKTSKPHVQRALDAWQNKAKQSEECQTGDDVEASKYQVSDGHGIADERG